MQKWFGPVALVSIVAVLVLVSWMSAAKAETRCIQPEQVGCVEIDFLVVSYDESNAELRNLIDGGKEPYELGVPIYKDVKAGRTKLYPGCVRYSVFFWGVDASVSESQMAVYRDGDSFAEPEPALRALIPNNAKSVYPTLGEPAASYEVEVCGGKGVFQVPWQYITANTYTLICAVGTGSLYPDSDVKEQGVWLTGPAWNFFREEGYEWVLIPLVMPDV